MSKVVVEIWGDVHLKANNHCQGNETLGIGKDIQQSNDVENTQEPIARRAPYMVHDTMHHSLQILNPSFDGILVLVMWLQLSVLDLIHVDDIVHGTGFF